MDQQRLNYLHQAYLDESLNAKEQEEWETYLQNNAQELPIKKLMDNTWHGIVPEERIVLNDSRSDEIFNEIVGEPEIKRVSIWSRIAVAAAMVAVIFGAGLFYYNLNHNHQQPNQTALKNDVAPGKSGATLTLASGKKIRLTDAANGELAKEAGVTITKSANGELIYELKDYSDELSKTNTLSTTNGETYRLRLPDGSQVWLNSASSLTYTASLNERGKRIVRLSGEGYFEVAKDKLHPFVVETASQQVEVLGTHFNINSYGDEPAVVTTLLEGSVKVTGGEEQKVLKPGEQALNSGSAIRVSKADLETTMDWKNDEFYLETMDFRVAMRKIARWYNVEVIYSGSVPDNLEAGGWIQRSRNLSDVLKAIESTGLAHFKIEGRRLYVNR